MCGKKNQSDQWFNSYVVFFFSFLGHINKNTEKDQEAKDSVNCNLSKCNPERWWYINIFLSTCSFPLLCNFQQKILNFYSFHSCNLGEGRWPSSNWQRIGSKIKDSKEHLIYRLLLPLLPVAICYYETINSK